MQTFDDLIAAGYRSVDQGDLGAAETYALRANTHAQEMGVSEMLGKALFLLGVVRHHQDHLAAAEAAFGEAVLHDERAYGPAHEAVADTLRSLALVQQSRDRLGAADAHFARAEQIYSECNPRQAAEVACRRGRLELNRGELDRAGDHFNRAIKEGKRGGAMVQSLRASHGVADVLWARKHFKQAFNVYMGMTRSSLSTEEAGAEVAYAWLQLGALSKAFNALFEAKFASSVAASSTASWVREQAVERLKKLSSIGPLECHDAWFLTHYSEESGGGHVGRSSKGLFAFDGPQPAAIGERVAVDLLDGDRVRVRPLH